MNGNKKDLFLWLTRGGMELSWLYAWATFGITAIAHRSFPLPEAIGTFVMAVIITVFIRGRAWRVVLIFGIHIIGFSLAMSRIVYMFTDRLYSYWSRQWVVAFLHRSRDPVEWMIFGIIIFFTLLFWLSGVRLAQRSDAYFAVCNRFDLGVAAFFCLFLITFLMRVRGGIEILDPTMKWLSFSFFIFGLMGIGIVNNKTGTQKAFLTGYRIIGLFLSFTVVVVGLGAGLGLLFLPYLTAIAEVGYGGLKTVVGPLNPILISVLRFLFSHRRNAMDTASRPSRSVEREFIDSSEGGWWSDIMEKIFSWSLFGLMGLMMTIIVVVGIWYLVRWLLSRTPSNEKEKVQWMLLAFFLKRLWMSIIMGWQTFVQRIKGHANGSQLFKALLHWGRRSGLPHHICETPKEYGRRLKNRFPFLSGEIEAIVDVFNKEVYGEVVLNTEQLKAARMARRKMCSPQYWPSRLKSWFLQPEMQHFR